MSVSVVFYSERHAHRYSVFGLFNSLASIIQRVSTVNSRDQNNKHLRLVCDFFIIISFSSSLIHFFFDFEAESTRIFFFFLKAIRRRFDVAFIFMPRRKWVLVRVSVQCFDTIYSSFGNQVKSICDSVIRFLCVFVFLCVLLLF